MRGKGICYDAGFMYAGGTSRHGEAYPDMAWEPKGAFAALADYYGASR
jgi:hypothetical protein